MPWNFLWNLIWILDIAKALENCTRRFRRNFDVGIFLNYPMLYNNFRKIQYAMS
jgi:hypothetical protein